jgi:hypothetical protein
VTEPDIGGDIKIVEVPLTGDEPVAVPGDTDPAPETNWRRVIGVALVVGSALGVVIAVLVLAGEDDSEAGDEPAPTAAANELLDRITTPPTLQALDSLPPPDITSEPVADEGPQATTSQDWSLFDGVELPVYAELPEVTPSELERYDIDVAVASLADDVPRQSETHLELGTAGFVLDVTIVRDPERDRYQITLVSRGQTQIAIVDNATGSTYLDPGNDDVRVVPNADIIAGSTSTDVNDYFDRLLLGPIRPDTIGEATTSGGGVVAIDDVGVVRRFDATVPGALIPEWQLYAFSPVFEFPVEDRPSSLDYAVYVDELDQVVQIDGLASVGDVPQLVQHRLTRLDPAPVIELPTLPTASAPAASTPTTTPTTGSPPTTTG